MKETFNVTMLEDYSTHIPPDKKTISDYMNDRNDGPDQEDLCIDMRGKISSKWNECVLNILVDIVIERRKQGKGWDGLPNCSEAYFLSLCKEQLECTQGVWRGAQAKMKEDREVETPEEVEKRMVEAKEQANPCKLRISKRDFPWKNIVAMA